MMSRRFLRAWIGFQGGSGKLGLVSRKVSASFEGITGISGVKNHVQVMCLEFRSKLRSQIDGGVQIESN